MNSEILSVVDFAETVAGNIANTTAYDHSEKVDAKRVYPARRLTEIKQQGQMQSQWKDADGKQSHSSGVFRCRSFCWQGRMELL